MFRPHYEGAKCLRVYEKSRNIFDFIEILQKM